MKKLLLLFSIFLSFSACSSDEPIVQPETDTSVEDNILPGYRTRQEIIDIAQEYADILYPTSAKSRSARRVVDESRVFALSDLKSRAAEESDIAPLICIVEYSDDNGFAIIATPKAVEPVIAIVDNGPFIGPNDTLPYRIMEYKTEIDTLYSFYIDSLVVTNRGQVFPEGALCANNLSGCFPTAALMLCEYFREPAHIKITFQNSNSTTYLNWDAISQLKSSNDPLKTLTISMLPIAQFTRQVGHLAGAKYLSGGTAIHRENEQPTLTQLLPNRTVGNLQNFKFSIIYETLKAKGLVMCAGKNAEGKGHA